MRKNETNLSLVLACMYLCIGIIQPGQLHANPYATGVVGASARLQNLPVIEISALGEHHLIVPQASEQLLVVTHLTPGETYSLRVPVDPAPGGCMPEVAVEGPVPATLFVDAVARTLTFVAEETSLTFRLSYPCDWGDPKYPRRHHVSVFCETCLQEAPSAEKVSSNALLQVTPSVNPDSVIRNVFIGNSCFDVQNVTFSGLAHQLGTFTSGETNIGIATGMVMSTANVNVGTGPNNHSGAQFPPHVGVPAVDADLQGLPGYNGFGLNDLAKIEFDFVPTESQVTFEFVFATEEYCEWVDEIYNDVFGFFISGPGIPGGKQNIAVVPNTSTEISVNTINHKTNTSYYTHNIGANSYMIPPLLLSAAQCNAQNNGNPVPYSNSPAINETQFDGFTKVLTATATVIPCETYHIALKIANVGDNRLDAAVFLRAGSFYGGGAAAPQWVVNNVPDATSTTEGCDVVELVFERAGGGTDELIIPLLISGTATPDVDYEAIPNPVVIPANASSVTIQVPIYSDQTLEGNETIIVRLVDSCECSNPQRTLLLENFSPEILGAPVFLAPGGTADISVNGVYSAYLWAPGGETDPLINVPAGTYTVTVTNGGGCTASASVSIAGCDLVVTTTADSGPGSLREAIACANSNPNADVITFDLPGGPPYEIILNTPLPVVSESVSIDATSQPGWSFGDVQLLPGDPIGFPAGLSFSASRCALRGIWVGLFTDGVGVQVNTAHSFTMTDCIVSDCEVGVQTGGDCNFLIDDCIVAYNALAGIDAGIAEKVQVRRNSMFCNGTDPGGDPFTPSFGSAPPPVITSATPTQISGTATYLPPIPTFPENIVEVFTTGDPACPNADVQGITFLASAVVNPDNTWSVTGNFPAGAILTATVTNPAACAVPPCGVWTADFDSYVVPGTTEVEFNGNTTGNPTEWSWDFGDGFTSNLQSPVHTFADYGVYEVCLTVTDAVCGEALITCQDICNLVPDFDYNVNPANYRDVQFTDLSLGSPTNWYWEFGDGGTDNVQNPAYLYAPGFGIQLLHLVIEKENCQEELYAFIDIAGCNIDVNFDWLVTPPFDVQFNDLSSGSPASWYWDFGDGDFSLQQSPAHTYPGSGTYDVYLEIEKDVVANGDNVTCQIWTERQIEFLAPCDTLSANYYIETPGDGWTIEFYDISAGNPVAWFWDFGDGNTSTLQNPTHTYTATGDFVVCLEVYSTDSLCQTSVCYLVEPNCNLLDAATSDFSLAACVDFPVTAGSNSPLCAGVAINLTNTPGGGTSPYTFSWEGPSGYTSIDENPVIPNATPAMSGAYTVTVTDVNGCTGTASVTVTVNPLPTTAISGDLDICIGGTTTLTASGGLSYAWSTGDLTADINVGAAGGYTVTVTDGNGCTDEATVTLVVNPLPVAAISGDLDICIGDATTLTASGGLSYEWSTGDLTADINVGVAGDYTVTVTDGNGCSDTETATVTVNPLPVANITGDFIICAGETTLLTASGGLSYAWSTGDLTSDINVGVAGDYTVTVTDGNGCTDEATVALVVNPLPVAAISGDLDICIGDATTLTASGGLSYAWSTGDLTADINVGAAGDYTVTVTDGNGCTDEATVTLVVNLLPTAAISGDLDICLGESTILTATGGTSYLWSTGDNTAATSVGLAGTYTVTVTDGNGCSDTETATVAVNPLPVANITGDFIICAGETTLLTASGGTSYAWSTGETTEDISVGVAGLYTVTVTDGNSCTSTTTINLTVNPLPTAAISGDLDICIGGTTTLTASDGLSYAWSTGDLTADINVGAAGNYTVTVTDGNGCTDEATVTLVVNPLPVAAILGILDYCIGGNTQLTATGGTDYLWEDNSTDPVRLVTAGTYTVTVTDANACSNIASVSVTESPTLTVVISGNLEYCAGSSTTLTAAGGVSYLWDDNSTNPVRQVTAGSYTVTATDANGCTGESSVVVTENALPVAAISGDLEICAGDATTLTASGGTGYAWSTAGVTADISVGAAGGYTVTVTDGNGCTDEATVTLIVNPLPVAAISGDLDICAGESTILTASGGTGYLWSTGDNTEATSIGLSGAYTVTVTDGNGCSDTETATVTVNPLPIAVISGDLNICAGDATTLTASGGTSYAWSTGETTQDISVSTSGLYTVTVTDGNACTSTTTIFLTVNPLPIATITGDLEICAGGSTVLTASGGLSYEWSTGDLTADINVGVAGDYTVTVTDGNGCTDEATVTLIVNPLPVAAISGDLDICAGEFTILTASGGTGYLWSTGDNTEATSIGLSGAYTVTVTDGNGCSDTETATVTVNPLPIAVISGDLNICAGDATTLTASGGTSYAWSTGETTQDISVGTSGLYTVTVTDGNTCTSTTTIFLTVNPLPMAAISGDLEICAGDATTLTASGGTGYAWSTGDLTPDISVGAAGGYTVTVTDGNGCTDEATVTLIVNPLPVAAISGDLDICAGESTILTASGGTGYLWSTGDNTEATSIGLSGAYTVTVTDGNGCSDTETATVTVNPLPIAVISGDLNICAGDATTLTASGGTSYAWSTGETTQDISVSTSGLYTVTVTDGNACTSTTTIFLTVNPLPIATITGDLEICAGGSTVLTASGGLSYEWSTGDLTADINVGVAGDYTVTVTDGNGCTDEATVTLIVNPLPVAAISGDLDICAGESTILTASGGTGYLWSTGDNTEATSVGLSGAYTVTITDGNGCSDTETATVAVNPLPIAVISGDLNICAGDATTLTASGGTSYAWSTGETTQDISVSTSGLYTVTVTDGNACTSTTTIFLTVNPLPIATITGDLEICAGGSTVLTASGGLSYEWSTGDLTADINVGVAGDYTVTVTDGNGCTDEATVTLIVNPLPVAAISGDLDICAGESTILTASGGTGYLWSTGDNTEATSVGLSGTYTVTVSDANICTSTAEATVVVNPLPTANITGDFNICAGEVTTLTASGGTSYTWSTGETTQDISVGTSGLYTVTVTDGNTCTSTTTIFLTVNPLPMAAISGDLEICAGDATTLTASGGTGYAWSTGDLTPDISVGAAGGYTVTVTDGNGCTDEATVTLIVNPLPVAAISGDLDICAGESTILTASGGTGYLWSTGDNTEATSVGLSGAYTVTITDGNGCSDTETATVAVNPLPIAVISGDLNICAGDATTLTASGGTSYAWSTGETTQDISVSTSGLYTVTVTDGNACTSTTTIFLTVNPLPIAAISGDLEICAGGSTVLTASGGTDYEWSTAEVTADISVGMAGGYTVTATDANGCTDTEAVSVSEFGYVVTTTADSGPGSFRQTLECASDIPGTNVITFNIPGSGPFEIKLTAPLPPVSDSTIIDATTQPGWGLGQIVLTPASPGLIAEGLTVTANKCQVSGLAFSGFAAVGVFATGANDFTLRDCRVDSCSTGVLVEASLRSVIENCVIANNLLGGIDAETASFVQVLRNTLYCNGGDPFVPASNATVPPAIDSATATIISGTATFVPGAQSLVQIFTANDPACLTADIQGKDFVAQADMQPDGRWSVSGNFTPGTQLTATQTYNPDGFFAPPAVGAKGSAFIFPPPGDASTSDFSPSACVGYNTTIVQPLCAGEVFNFNGIDYGVTGTYVANLVASDGCDSVVTLNLQVFPVFIAVQQASICAGDSLIVGGTFQTEQGLYVDTLQKANGCDSIVYTFLFINDLPTVAINAPNVICPGDMATLSVAGNFNGYLWGPGGAQTSAITIDTAGMYSVTVTDINGCTAADTVDIVEYCNSVTALFEVNQDTACIAHFVQFTDKSSPNTTGWFWDFGNGNSSVEQNPFDIYPVPGTYTVTLVAFDGVGSDTFKTNLFVYDSMATNFLFAVPDSCTPNLVQFTDAITTLFPIATWQWNFGDGQFGNTSSPGHLYEVFDTANVNLTITDIYNCTTSISRNVEVIDFGRTPEPVFRNVTLCENQPYLGILYAQDTTLVDTLVAASGCDSIVVTNISVDQVPNQLAAAGPDADVCLGPSILSLQAVAAGVGYGTWTALTPDVSINNSNNPNTTVSNLSDGANIFVWSLSNGACLDYSMDTVVLNIIPAPGEIAEAGDDVLFCQQLPTTTLAATPPVLSGVTGFWSQSVAQAQSGVVIANPANWNTSVSGLKPGNVYEFRWTLRTVLCGDFSSDVVRINLALEQANAGPNQQTCPQESETVLLANLPAGATGQWRTAGATTAVIESPQSAETDVSGLVVGANVFIWTLSAPGCPDYTSDTVVVTAYGAFEAKEDVFFNLGQSGTLRLDVLANDVLPNSPFITVTALLPVPDGLSDNGDGSFTYVFDTTFQEKIIFRYRVCVADCPGLCDDATVTILSEPPPTPAPPIEPPKNVITPNEDGVGDALKIPNFETYANDIELIILSRWGDVVYQTKRYDNNWQGVNSNGKPLPDGTYYYIIRAGVQDNLVINGTITILR